MQDIIKETTTRMTKSIDALKTELSKIRTGRASPALLDHIKVNCYGMDSPLSQVASVTAEARALLISPWDKSIVPLIEKAIINSDLGLNPVAAGNVIRVPMPPLSQERRKELVKIVKDQAEHSRVSIRSIRRDANQNLKDLLKNKSINEDEERRGQTEIQKLTDKFIEEVDKILAKKDAELMEV